MTNVDYIIVGGGVIGCAIAYNLAKAKASVLVLEKSEIGTGASSRNGGGVRQSGRDPRELPVAMFGVRELWPTLWEELDADVEYHKKGNLRLGKTAEHRKVLEKLVSQGQSAGLEQTLIDYDEIKDHQPLCVGAGDRRQLVYYRRACQSDAGPRWPFTAVPGSWGAQFITGEEITSILMAKGRAVGVQNENLVVLCR